MIQVSPPALCRAGRLELALLANGGCQGREVVRSPHLALFYLHPHTQRGKYALANTAEQTRASMPCQAGLWALSCSTKGNKDHFFHKGPLPAAQCQGRIHPVCFSEESWFRTSPRVVTLQAGSEKHLWPSLSTPDQGEAGSVCHSQGGWQRAQVCSWWEAETEPATNQPKEIPLHPHWLLRAAFHLCQQPGKPSRDNRAQGKHFPWSLHGCPKQVCVGMQAEGWSCFWRIAHPSGG